MHARILAAALAAVLVVHPADAQAQTPARPASSGSAMSLMGGAGVGWTRVACGFCRRNLDAGPVVYLQAIMPVRPTLSLGAEGNVWARDDEVFALVGSISAVARLTPRAGGPFYLKGGLGYVTYRAYDDDADLVSNAPAMQFGAGYTYQISEGLALNNFLNVLVSRFGTLKSEETTVVENFGITSLQQGIGLTRH